MLYTNQCPLYCFFRCLIVSRLIVFRLLSPSLVITFNSLQYSLLQSKTLAACLSGFLGTSINGILRKIHWGSKLMTQSSREENMLRPFLWVRSWNRLTYAHICILYSNTCCQALNAVLLTDNNISNFICLFPYSLTQTETQGFSLHTSNVYLFSLRKTYYFLLSGGYLFLSFRGKEKKPAKEKITISPFMHAVSFDVNT